MEWLLLADLPPEDVRELLAVARRRTFERGEIVFHRADRADTLHLIVRGHFAARVLTPLGDSVLLEVLAPAGRSGSWRSSCPARAARPRSRRSRRARRARSSGTTSTGSSGGTRA